MNLLPIDGRRREEEMGESEKSSKARLFQEPNTSF